MNSQLPAESPPSRATCGPCLLAVWHPGPGSATTSQRKVAAFTAASLTVKLHPWPQLGDSAWLPPMKNFLSTGVWPWRAGSL